MLLDLQEYVMSSNLLQRIIPTVKLKKSIGRLRKKISTENNKLKESPKESQQALSLASPKWSGVYCELPSYLQDLHKSTLVCETHDNITSEAERQYVSGLVEKLPVGAKNAMLHLLGQATVIPQTIRKFVEMLMLVLPENLNDLIRASALERLKNMKLTEYSSVYAFVWEHRRLTSICQCSDQKAFQLFLKSIVAALRVAISGTNIGYKTLELCFQYEHYHIDEQPEIISLDRHHDRTLFASHIPAKLFYKILAKTSEKLDSVDLGMPIWPVRPLKGNKLQTLETELHPTTDYAWGLQRTNNPAGDLMLNKGFLFFNQRLCVSQSHQMDIAKHWGKCFRSTETDTHLFGLLLGNSLAPEPVCDLVTDSMRPRSNSSNDLNSTSQIPSRRYGPWKIVAITIIENVGRSRDILYLTCCETYEIVLCSIPKSDSLSSHELIQNHLYGIMHQLGYPLVLLVDRSQALVRRDVYRYWRSHGITVYYSSIYEDTHMPRTLLGIYQMLVRKCIEQNGFNIDNLESFTHVFNHYVNSSSLYTADLTPETFYLIQGIRQLVSTETYLTDTINESRSDIEFIISQPPLNSDLRLIVPWTS